jgi:hypothetical protein
MPLLCIICIDTKTYNNKMYIMRYLARCPYYIAYCFASFVLLVVVAVY